MLHVFNQRWFHLEKYLVFASQSFAKANRTYVFFLQPARHKTIIQAWTMQGWPNSSDETPRLTIAYVAKYRHLAADIRL